MQCFVMLLLYTDKIIIVVGRQTNCIHKSFHISFSFSEGYETYSLSIFSLKVYNLVWLEIFYYVPWFKKDSKTVKWN